MKNTSPIVVKITRGDLVEKEHEVNMSVCDSTGKELYSYGDTRKLVMPRSAIKSVQALAYVNSGAVEKYNLNSEELALSCSSHNGEDIHAGIAEKWLSKMGLGVNDLECGTMDSISGKVNKEAWSSGKSFNQLHHNCSGKHCGMLALAKCSGNDSKNYIDYGHESQRAIVGIFSELTGKNIASNPYGIDGCGVPTIGIELSDIALMMARFVHPESLKPKTGKSAKLLLKSIQENPYLIAGKGRFDTEFMASNGGKVITKIGADGVVTAAIPEKKIGIAMKVRDGFLPAAEFVLVNFLRKKLGLGEQYVQDHFLSQSVLNNAGKRIGQYVVEI